MPPMQKHDPRTLILRSAPALESAALFFLKYMHENEAALSHFVRYVSKKRAAALRMGKSEAF